MLNLITKNSKIYDFTNKEYNETFNTISKTIYNDTHGINVQSGDIYVRFNNKNNCYRFYIFDGTKFHSFDHSYGAGILSYNVIFIDVNKIIDYLINNKELHSLLYALNNQAKLYGMKIIEN